MLTDIFPHWSSVTLCTFLLLCRFNVSWQIPNQKLFRWHNLRKAQSYPSCLSSFDQLAWLILEIHCGILCFQKHSDRLWFAAFCHSHFVFIVCCSDFKQGSTRSEGLCLRCSNIIIMLNHWPSSILRTHFGCVNWISASFVLLQRVALDSSLSF